MSLLDGQHEGQKGTITYIRKKGNQQTTKTPMIIPRVLAALLSLDKLIRCLSSMNWYTPPVFFGRSITTTLEAGFLLLEFITVIVVHGLEFFVLLISGVGFSLVFWELDEFSPAIRNSLLVPWNLYSAMFQWR